MIWPRGEMINIVTGMMIWLTGIMIWLIGMMIWLTGIMIWLIGVMIWLTGMMIEFMAGKSAAMEGMCHDATPFTFTEDQPAIDHFGKWLTQG